MTVQELKTGLYNIAAKYFAGARVIWAEQSMDKPVLPLVTLRLGSVQRELFPIVEIRGGAPVSLYPSRTVMEVNLYTAGTVTAQPGRTAAAVNTALGDMQDFLNYLASPLAGDMLDRLDIALLPEGPARDVSALLNANQYEYRAMQEFTVDFLQEAHGAAGISPHAPSVTDPGAPGTPADPDNPDVSPEPVIPVWEPTASGGGTQELADAATGWFEDVELTDDDLKKGV